MLKHASSLRILLRTSSEHDQTALETADRSPGTAPSS